jgi:hypothetical protein
MDGVIKELKRISIPCTIKDCMGPAWLVETYYKDGEHSPNKDRLYWRCECSMCGVMEFNQKDINTALKRWFRKRLDFIIVIGEKKWETGG